MRVPEVIGERVPVLICLEALRVVGPVLGFRRATLGNAPKPNALEGNPILLVQLSVQLRRRYENWHVHFIDLEEEVDGGLVRDKDDSTLRGELLKSKWRTQLLESEPFGAGDSSKDLGRVGPWPAAALTLALAPLAHKESKQKVRALRCSKPETNRRGFSLRKRPS